MGKNAKKKAMRREREISRQICDEANAINAGSKAFSPASLRGISAQAGKHKISLLNADGSKKRINYSNQKIKCNPDVKSGLRLSDLLSDKTGRIEKSKASLRLMQARIGANIDNMTRLVESARNCAALVDTGETIDNIALYKPNASLQAIYDESRRADVRGIKFDNDASKVLLVKRTKKGTTRVLRLRPVSDSIRVKIIKPSNGGFYGVYRPIESFKTWQDSMLEIQKMIVE